MAKEFDLIQWYDEEVWTKIFTTAAGLKKINNTSDFKLIHNLMHKLNAGSGQDSPYSHLKGKFDKQIESMLERHYYS